MAESSGEFTSIGPQRRKQCAPYRVPPMPDPRNDKNKRNLIRTLPNSIRRNISQIFDERQFGHMTVRINKCMYVFGGWGNEFGISLKKILKYNFSSQQLTEYMINAGAIPPCTYKGCAVVIKDDIYMHGGVLLEHDFEIGGELWRLSGYKDDRFKWKRLYFTNKSKPAPRADHSGWEYDDMLYIFGGIGPNPADYFHNVLANIQKTELGTYINNEIFRFEPKKNEWFAMMDRGDRPAPRLCHSVTKIHSTIWLYGGITVLNRKDWGMLYDLYTLDMHDLTWTEIKIMGPVIPVGFSTGPTITAVTTDEIILLGGYHNTNIWVFDICSKTWRKHPVNFRFLLSDYTVDAFDQTIVVFGGTFSFGSKVIATIELNNEQ